MVGSGAGWVGHSSSKPQHTKCTLQLSLMRAPDELPRYTPHTHFAAEPEEGSRAAKKEINKPCLHWEAQSQCDHAFHKFVPVHKAGAGVNSPQICFQDDLLTAMGDAQHLFWACSQATTKTTGTAQVQETPNATTATVLHLSNTQCKPFQSALC